jgi:hypothetical protein
MRRFAHQRRVRLGQRLQARGEIHRIAENRDPCVGTLLHSSDHRCPGIETDPQSRPHAGRGAGLMPKAFGTILLRRRWP